MKISEIDEKLKKEIKEKCLFKAIDDTDLLRLTSRESFMYADALYEATIWGLTH